MMKLIRFRALAAASIAAAMAFTSCTYPYYGSAGGSYGTPTTYNEGYGYGYGYGSSNFSTSFFVSTGNPRWAYDPYCYAYYDYHRRCYYDPYLNGYYPVGYRPPVIVGCPHPHGWRSGYCPPPTYVRNVTVVNYRNREQAYRGTNYDWARQVRQRPVNPGSNRYASGGDWARQPDRRTIDSRPAGGAGSVRQSPGYNRNSGREEARPQPQGYQTRGARLPQGYNAPVTRDSGRSEVRQPQTSSRYGQRQEIQPRQPSFRSQPGVQRTPQAPPQPRVRQAAPPPRQQAPARQPQQAPGGGGRSEEQRPARGIHPLGQG